MAKKEPGGVACKYSTSCFTCPCKDCTINDAEVTTVNQTPYEIGQRRRRNAGKSEKRHRVPNCRRATRTAPAAGISATRMVTVAAG